MCDQCNGVSAQQVLQVMQLDIARYGWAAQYVEGGMEGASLGYTIGLTELAHPEVLITGRSGAETYRILDELALMVVAHGHILEPGMVLKLHERPVCLLPIERPGQVLLTADTLYGHHLEALQAVWADDAGRFPWQQSPPDVLTQPLYGHPSLL